MEFPTFLHSIIGSLLILSSLIMIIAKKPMYSCLAFLFTLILLASLFIALSAEFIGIMQILVYAGTILVIFVFVVVLFQDAYQQIEKYESQSQPILLWGAVSLLLLALFFSAMRWGILPLTPIDSPAGFGTAQNLGKALYVEGFFPFEAVVLLFLVAIVGTLYIAKKDI